MKSAIVAFLYLSSLIACSQKNEPLNSVLWVKGSGQSPPFFLEHKESQNSIQIKYQNEVLSRDLLTYKGAEIEGAYVQKILDKNNNSIFIKSQFSEMDLRSLDSAIARSLKNKYVALLQFKSKFKELHQASFIWDPRLMITFNGLRPSLLWIIDYQSPYNLGASRLKITIGGSLVTNTPIGSFFDYQAVVYPAGPKFSELSEVILDNLFGNGFLMSRGLKVYNDLVDQAQDKNGKFNFPPQDNRFNQVQTYYFIDQHLKYYLHQHQLQLPFAIEARVNVTDDQGHPTTCTGYVHQRITLGDGDGILWNHIPQDPSIVMHETSHAIVEALAGLSYEGEEGILNEAYADFLTASHLKSPHMGNVAYMKSPYKRTLETLTKFSEQTGGKYHDSLIFSGALWEIRSLLGSQKAETLALLSLPRLGPNSHLVDFSTSLKLAASSFLTQSDQQKILDLLKKRDF